jgi:hypothetical protein
VQLEKAGANPAFVTWVIRLELAILDLKDPYQDYQLKA